MSDINDGGPAFPVPQHQPLLNGGWLSEYVGYPRSGMTLRDYFAAQVLSGWNETCHHLAFAIFGNGDYGPDVMAQVAYRIADAMLAEREKKGGA